MLKAMFNRALGSKDHQKICEGKSCYDVGFFVDEEALDDGFDGL